MLHVPKNGKFGCTNEMRQLIFISHFLQRGNYGKNYSYEPAGENSRDLTQFNSPVTGAGRFCSKNSHRHQVGGVFGKCADRMGEKPGDKGG